MGLWKHCNGRHQGRGEKGDDRTLSVLRAVACRVLLSPGGVTRSARPCSTMNGKLMDAMEACTNCSRVWRGGGIAVRYASWAHAYEGPHASKTRTLDRAIISKPDCRRSLPLYTRGSASTRSSFFLSLKHCKTWLGLQETAGAVVCLGGRVQNEKGERSVHPTHKSAPVHTNSCCNVRPALIPLSRALSHKYATTALLVQLTRG